MTTLIWLPAPFREAMPSMPVCAGGVVTSMFPDMSPYHLYVQYEPFGEPPVSVRVSPSVP